MEIIKTTQIDEEDQIMKLSDTYWRDYLKEKNYNTDVNAMCGICIKEQIEKHGSQVIPCKGLNTAKEQSPSLASYENFTKNLTKEDIKDLDSFYNPFTYMERNLDIDNPKRTFQERFYQKLIISCSAREKVVRMGRRCIPGYERVLLSNGFTKPMSEVSVGDVVTSYRDGKRVSNRVTDKWSNGIKRVFKITLEDGKELSCTSNHPILIKTEKSATWKTIEEGLSVEDEAIISRNEGDFKARKILSIVDKGEEQTFDITVENDHNFVVNDIVTHNTGKSQSIAMLAVHKAIMSDPDKPPFRILLVSPFAVQTEEVINTIREICRILPENPIVSYKQTPAHKITFNNGAVLMGFTAATNGDQIRGQPADLILLDETDDIPETAIVSIMGIKMQNPEVEVWRSGTPKGEKNLHRAEQAKFVKSFHYPSYVNPAYSDEMDISLRDEMGEGVGYVEEVLAEISSSSNQVFQSVFINRALHKPYYTEAMEVLSDRSRYIVFIGVDWNHDKVGSRILVIAYDKISPQFFIIEKEKVAIEGFTQYAAVEKIIQLNRKFSCDHIFVDQGFCSTQIADLKQFGMSKVGIVPKGHPDLKLMDTEAIDYGSSTEIRDPMSGEVYKTPTKQLAVLNTVEVFEKNLITLQKEEDRDIVLQLKNYVEKSRNKGRIVYGYVSKKIGDHDLDALMIGLFGIKKTYSTLFLGESTQALIKIVNKGENTVGLTTEEASDAHPIFGLSFGGSRSSVRNKNNRGVSQPSSRLKGLSRKGSRV